MAAAAARGDADLARPRTAGTTNDALTAAIQLQAGIGEEEPGEHFLHIMGGLVDELFHG
jgi:hypothetical protein